MSISELKQKALEEVGWSVEAWSLLHLMDDPPEYSMEEGKPVAAIWSFDKYFPSKFPWLQIKQLSVGCAG